MIPELNFRQDSCCENASPELRASVITDPQSESAAITHIGVRSYSTDVFGKRVSQVDQPETTLMLIARDCQSDLMPSALPGHKNCSKCGKSIVAVCGLCRKCYYKNWRNRKYYAGLRELSLRQGGYRCCASGMLHVEGLVVHHIVPKVNYGLLLIPMCRACHNIVHHTLCLRRPVSQQIQVLWRICHPNSAEQACLPFDWDVLRLQLRYRKSVPTIANDGLIKTMDNQIDFDQLCFSFDIELAKEEINPTAHDGINLVVSHLLTIELTRTATEGATR